MGHIGEFLCVVKAFTLLAPTLVSLEMVSALLDLHPPDIDSLIRIPCWTFNLIQTLNSLWTFLG
jgi:hypothetical protein